MPELKGSKTEANLQTAFAGECMARIKYDFYSSKAAKDGFQQIGAFFEETSNNEKEHAKIWFKELHGGSVPDTLTNLKDGSAGEYYEWHEMYEGFAKTAKEEGFNRIADLFEGVAAIEHSHDDRYKKLIERMQDGEVFRADGKVFWVCRNCGHIHYGEEAPQICPVCAHPQAYFERQETNY